MVANKKRFRVTIELPRTKLAKLEAIAAREGKTRREYILGLVDTWLAKEKQATAE